MSSKNTWLWMTMAVAVLGFILLFDRYRTRPLTGPRYLLPDLNVKAVRTVQIRPAGRPEIHLQHTNGVWQLVEPVVYPAESTNVQNLLNALQNLTVAHYISDPELRKDPKADEHYGIEPPQISLVLDSGNPIHFGYRTSPGDQVFVQVVGIGGVFIVDSDLLNLFPKNADAWRQTELIDFTQLAFDRITVTNTAKGQSSFQLQRDATNRLWALTAPMLARADKDKVEAALQGLQKLRVQQFLRDDPKADLDSFGLQSPDLTIAFAEGTNTLFALDFGKAVTNNPSWVYARRRDQDTIVALSTNVLPVWGASYEIFRDRHLVTLLGPIEAIAVEAQDNFVLKWQTNNSWHILPRDFPADPDLASGLARSLSDMQVTDFEKDSVTEPLLPHYGLAKPVRKYILSWSTSNTATNPPTELDFGTNGDNKIFARRVGEDAVYAISPSDFNALFSASWELHDRQIWNFDASDISRITIQQNGQTRQIVHGTNGWSPVGQGIVNDSAVEDTARELGHLKAFSWVGNGAGKLSNFGITSESYRLSLELKNGEKKELQFGGVTRLGSAYASVILDGEPWIFEFPPDVYSSIQFCLTIPPAQ